MMTESKNQLFDKKTENNYSTICQLIGLRLILATFSILQHKTYRLFLDSGLKLLNTLLLIYLLSVDKFIYQLVTSALHQFHHSWNFSATSLTQISNSQITAQEWNENAYSRRTTAIFSPPLIKMLTHSQPGSWLFFLYLDCTTWYQLVRNAMTLFFSFSSAQFLFLWKKRHRPPLVSFFFHLFLVTQTIKRGTDPASLPSILTFIIKKAERF